MLRIMEKQVKIRDLKIDYTVDYRHIKYPRLEFKTGRLLLVLPKNYKKEKRLIEKHKKWIYKKKSLIEFARKKAKEKIIDPKSNTELKNLIQSSIDKFAKEYQAYPNQVFFRKMKSKWASCSPKNNLTFNILIKYLPKSLIKYVVFHEIAHLVERNHSERFWNIVSQKFKNFREKEKDLMIYWFLLQNIAK